MNRLVISMAMLVGLFCATPLLAQFDTSSNPPVKPEKLNKFIKDSIERHHLSVMIGVDMPYKYCLPHVCLNRMGKYGLVGFDHQPLSAFEFDDIKSGWQEGAYIVRKGQLHGCIDTTGKWLLPVQYPQLFFTPIHRLISTGERKLWDPSFVYDFQGKPVLPDTFIYAGLLEWGSRTVIKARKKFVDTLYLFDLQGHPLKAYPALDMEPLSHGNGNRYAVKLSSSVGAEQYMVVDSNFQLIAPQGIRTPDWANENWVYYLEYYHGNDKIRPNEMYSIATQKFYPFDNRISPLKNHSEVIVSEGHKEGLLDHQLKTIVPPQVFTQIKEVPGYDLFIVRSLQYKYGLIDRKGTMLLDTIYTDIQPTKISDFLKVDHSLYQMDKKAFINGYPTVITSELYLLRPEDGPESLMHKSGRQISPVDRIWPTKSQMVVVKKEPTSNQVQVYDRSGNLFRELDNWPQSLELPKREFFTWADNNRKVGILDAGFNTIIPPQYDAVYLLSNIPEQFRVFWVKYAFRNPEHLFVGWIWNSDKTVPLLIKENGKVVSVREL